jgi:hypothetical protein
MGDGVTGPKIEVDHLALQDLPEEKLMEVYRVDYERKAKAGRARKLAADARKSSEPEAKGKK